jgi:hypothetical protein
MSLIYDEQKDMAPNCRFVCGSSKNFLAYIIFYCVIGNLGTWLAGCFSSSIMRKTSVATLHVVIISDKVKTLDNLCGYLHTIGVASQSAKTLQDLNSFPSKTTAIVLFPDEFAVDDAIASIILLRSLRPKRLILIVTSTPQHFRSALLPDGLSLPPIVLPKPVFGWAILDAILAYAHLETP